MKNKEKVPKHPLVAYLVFLRFGGGIGAGIMVALERLSCSLRIKDMAFPSGTMILELFCRDAEMVSSCLNTTALSLK